MLRQGVRYRFVSRTCDQLLQAVLGRVSKSLSQPSFHSWLFQLGYMLQVSAMVGLDGFDIVHVANFSQLPPLIRKWRPRIRCFLHMHCEWLNQLDPAVVRRRLRHVDAVICCSDYLTDKIRMLFPDLAERFHTVYNGVDTEIFRDGPRAERGGSSPRLLYAGRISPEKGLHVLIEALAQVVRKFPHTVLTMVGAKSQCPRDFIVGVSKDPLVASLRQFYTDRPYWRILQDRIAAAGLEKNVEMLDLVPPAVLAEQYRRCDAVVCPSFSESFGMQLVEGFATARCAIGSRIGGIPEVIEDGRCGLLVPPNDPQALAGALLRVLGDNELRRRMGQAARRRVEQKFAWPVIAGQLKRLYECIGSGIADQPASVAETADEASLVPTGPSPASHALAAEDGGFLASSGR